MLHPAVERYVTKESFLLQPVQLGPEIRMACTGMCTHSRKVRVLGSCRKESINFTLGRLRSFHFLGLVPFCLFHSADYLPDAVNKLFTSHSKIYCRQKVLILDLLLLHACLLNLQFEGVSPSFVLDHYNFPFVEC